MKQHINEIKRMQQLAGILKEAMFVDTQGNLKSSYDSNFNARKKYIETPPELIDMLQEYGIRLDDEIYLFFDQSLSLDDLEDPEDEDYFKDAILGRKENPNSSIRTNRNEWYNKELFQTIQKLDFIDSPEKIQEVLEFYFYQPFSMRTYFTTEYFDTEEEAREEWEATDGRNRLLTYNEYKQLYDTYGEDEKRDEWV